MLLTRMLIKIALVFNTEISNKGIVAKATGLKMLPQHVANAHQKGEIHYQVTWIILRINH